jgi:hypothetical protein
MHAPGFSGSAVLQNSTPALSETLLFLFIYYFNDVTFASMDLLQFHAPIDSIHFFLCTINNITCCQSCKKRLEGKNPIGKGVLEKSMLEPFKWQS